MRSNHSPVTGQVAVLIPAFNPSAALIGLVDEVYRLGIAAAVIVVDDGSTASCQPVFTALRECGKGVVLQHPVNKGKGAALKSGFEYVLRCLPDIACVVTVDADGQHNPDDIRRVVLEWLEHPDSVVLGARSLDATVPTRSRFGNALTAVVVRLLLGVAIRDTQTGLRALPASCLPSLLRITYDRYDFEMEALVLCKRRRTAIREVPIETIYVDGNSGSHFNPLIDSVKIYMVLLRYVAASVVTTAVDFLVFITLSRYAWSLMLLTYASRLVALGVNYTMVRSVVFHSGETVSHTLPKYLALVAVSGFLSGALVTYCVASWGVGPIAAKMVAETTLFAANFLVQRGLIFGTSERP